MIDDPDFQYAETSDIIVSACPVLIEDEQEMTCARKLWGYYLCIENHSDKKISLIGKDWNITDDKGNRFSDDSYGFKGEIPELEPGECFEFTSTAPLNADMAVFYGVCRIKKEGQEDIEDIKVPTFYLSTPEAPKSSLLH